MRPPRDDRRRERDHRPMRLRVTLERQHEGVTVDDAGRGRKQRAVRPQRRLERAGLRAAEAEEVVDAVRLRLCLERRKLGDLALVGGDDQLAAAPVRHAVLAAEAVKHRLALDAQPSLGKAGRVIDPSVDDFAVARAHPRPDGVFRLDDDDLAASPRQRARDRETDNTGADNEAFDCVHDGLQRVEATTLNNPPASVRPAPCRHPT